jgi:excisionase family DNA binding protein
LLVLMAGEAGLRLGEMVALEWGDIVGPDHHEFRRTPLPVLLTVDEAADLLRTTRRGIYAMIERRQLPGVTRVRRRVLVRRRRFAKTGWTRSARHHQRSNR